MNERTRLANEYLSVLTIKEIRDLLSALNLSVLAGILAISSTIILETIMEVKKEEFN